MCEAFRQLAMAIAASRRLGWIALGLYVKRLSIQVPKNKYYADPADYHRATGNSYNFVELSFRWADDYRMIYFPDEFSLRLDAIDEEWYPYHVKELQKANVIRRMQRARIEVNAW